MKTRELRDLTADELRQRQDEARKELFNLRIRQSVGNIEKPSRIRELRRDIARMLTIDQERKATEGSKHA